MKIRKVPCGICQGRGFIMKLAPTRQEQIKARKLREQGMTLKEIGKKVGLDHPFKVSNLIKGKDIV